MIRVMTLVMIAVVMTVMVNPITAYAAVDTVTTDGDGNTTYTNGDDGQTYGTQTNPNGYGHQLTYGTQSGTNHTTTSNHSGSYNGRDYKNKKYYPSRSTKSRTTSKNSQSSNGKAVLNFSYFDDDYFFQLNTKVFPEEVYSIKGFNKLVSNLSGYDFDDSIDDSHFTTSYVAPVMYDGTSYMSVYDYTYVYSNDELTADFMNLMATDTSLRNQIFTADEYKDATAVYNKYVNSSTYDVNPYIYHYIVEYIDITYGDKLFDYDFYCDKYPMLADLYEYDEDALKQHFYSIGMFEGRQGIATFNVDNYTTATDDLASYYIQYVTTSDASNSYKKTSKDTYQMRLYDVGFEAYVLNVEEDHESKTFRKDLADPYVQGELNALASDRIRFQLGDYEAHGHDRMNDYFKSDECALHDIGLKISDFTKAGENIFSQNANNSTKLSDPLSQELSDTMITWRKCQSHYDAATSADYIYVGQAHIYADYNPENEGDGVKANTIFYTGLTIMFGDTDSDLLQSVYDAK